MIETQNTKRYDLEERTMRFAREVRELVKRLPRNVWNHEDGRQLVRSSGSVGANYIEANEALGKKDFLMRIKICRKEAKESQYWLNLIETEENSEFDKQRVALLKEANEIMKIFGAILRKSE